MISLNELAMPMIGRPISQSVNPCALSKERWGALSGPLVIRSLRLVMGSSFQYLEFNRNGLLLRLWILIAKSHWLSSTFAIRPVAVQPRRPGRELDSGPA